jgi:hypothetical protein
VTALPPLIGLIGKKRVGKDTFAAVLVEEFGFARVAFADPLKAMALTIDPWALPGDEHRLFMRLTDLIDDEGWEVAKEEYPEVRRFLQRLGDGVRQFDPEFWVGAGMYAADIARRGVFAHRNADYYAEGKSPKPVVITDVRYPNEADAIRDAGGTLIRIVRPDADDGDTHASETALDGYAADTVVSNQGSLDLLTWSARQFARESLA